MKRMTAFVMLIILSVFVVSGCTSQPEKEQRVSVVCTNFAVYDWVKQISDCRYTEEIEITLLGGSGDIHSYQPTAKDMTKVQTCDLFIYIGGESDKWAEDVVKNNNINYLKLFDVLKEELICNTHEHDHGKEYHDHGAGDYDEHIWLSPLLAAKSIEAICDKVMAFAGILDTEHNENEAAECFLKNKTEMLGQCESLDREYENAVLTSKDKTVVFADRFPFAYLTKNYGIQCVAAFPGCSADQDVSFEVIAKLASAVEQNDKTAILVLENSNQKVAKTVIESVKDQNVEIAVMNSMQTISEQEIAQGADYFEIMEENLEALKKALD